MRYDGVMSYVKRLYPTDLKPREWRVMAQPLERAARPQRATFEPMLPKPEAKNGRWPLERWPFEGPGPLTGRPRVWSLCLILNAIFYVTRGGIAWRMKVAV